MNLAQYIIRRIIYAVPLLIIVSFISFLIITLPPGDYMTTFQRQLVNQAGLTRAEANEIAERMRARYGLDKPFIVQYFSWVKNIVLDGEFGFSFYYNKPVSQIIWKRLGYTLIIAILCHLISVIVGVLVGIYSATHKYSIGDNLATIFAFLGVSIPAFFLALVILYWMSFKMGLHVGGLFSPEFVMAPWSVAKFWDFLKHLWIPVVIVGFAGTARNMRVMRGNLMDVLSQQYIQTARAKGLHEKLVIYKHALKNALQPLIMSLGMAMPFLIQGEIITSTVLGLPTTGPAFYHALMTQDMYLAGSFLMLIAVILIIGNLLADIALAWVDPRVRYE